MGIIADVLWYEIKHHANNIKLAEFVVMPNHIHGILVLCDANDNTDANRPTNNNVETRHALSLQPQSQSQLQSQSHQTGQQRFQNQGKNTISSIVGSYKSAVTKHAHRLGFDFQWQRNFWEHIIRNENEYKDEAQGNPVLSRFTGQINKTTQHYPPGS